MKLRDDQVAGADFLASQFRAGLFDEPGLGKTAQVLTALRALGEERVVVLGPAIGRIVWQDEAQRWHPALIDTLHVESYQRFLVNRARRAELLATNPRVLVLDESHNLRGVDARRTSAVLTLARNVERVWYLTGTPMPAGPRDLYPMLRATWPDLLAKYGIRTYNQWVTRTHHVTYDGGTPVLRGMRDAGLLNELLWQSGYFLRRTLAEVGHALPPLVWSHQRIAAPLPAVPPEDADALEDLEPVLLRAVDAGQTLDVPEVARLRRLLGEAKAPAVALVLVQELRDDPARRPVIFAWHRSVLDCIQHTLAAAGCSLVRVDGMTTDRARAEAVQAFQTGRARAFLGQLRACETAITLTAGTHVEFVEQDWLGDTQVQAAKRVHRTGQNAHTFARLWSLADTLDDAVVAAATRRLREEAQIGLGSGA